MKIITRIVLFNVMLVSFALATPLLAQTSLPPEQTRSIDPRNFDTTCAPCTNFYQFANGRWIAAHPIPAEYSQWSNMMELRERNAKKLHLILVQVASRGEANKDPSVRKMARLYNACMDSAAIERLGAAPLAGDLHMVDAIRTPQDVRAYLMQVHARGLYDVFSFTPVQDTKDATRVIGAVEQGGLGLPDRSYYLENDSSTVTVRNSYLKHVTRDFVLAGESPAQADSDVQRVMQIETALARASFTEVQERDPVLVYNPKTLPQLEALAPGLDWKQYLATLHVPDRTSINVLEPRFLSAVDSLLGAAPVESWKAYFRWHLVTEMAPMLSTPFVDEDFAFDRVLTGTQQQLPRFKRCVTVVSDGMGHVLGKLYVEQYFTPAARARALKMVKNLKAAFRARLATRVWMSDSTRRQAYAKLDAMVDQIGYPDRWRNYSTLDIPAGGSYYASHWAVLSYSNKHALAKIGKPPNNTEWEMTTPTVNANYSEKMNTIAFPAGILQPPIFDPKADDAINYGGIGAVIGHEITHGFDDTGGQFDQHGNLRQWFTNADLQKFKERTSNVEKQFDAYTVLDSLHVNGKLTLGENIADLGGVTIAYDALERSMKGKPRPPKIDGFTQEQRFFLSFAQLWRYTVRPEKLRVRLRTDEHSPQIWRTNGPLSNMPEFAKAWGCKAGDPMARPPGIRAEIW